MGSARSKIQRFVIWFTVFILLLFLFLAVKADAYVTEFDDDVKLTADESLLWFYNSIYYVNFGASSSLAANYNFLWPVNDGDSDQYLRTDGSGVLSWSTSFASISLLEQSANPDAPADGQALIWLSDGSGYGDAGDVMIASTTSSVTRYGTLFDFSGGTLWEADVMIFEDDDVMIFENDDVMVYE